MLWILCLIPSSLQEPGGGSPQLQEPALEWLEPVHGQFSTRYRERWTSDQSDSDLYQFIRADYGDRERDLLTGGVSARFAEDLDGNRRSAGFYPFDSLDDTYSHRATQRVYSAFIELNRPFAGFRMRAGRQTPDEFPEAVPMDGASARYEPGPWGALSVAAGRPVNLFESSPGGDRLYATALEAVPWAGARLRAEYLHLDDRNVFGLFDDDLVALSYEERAGPVSWRARHTWLERESRETSLWASGGVADWGLLIQGQASYLHERQQALSYGIDPYSLFLLELEPYTQASLRASQPLGERFSIDLSATARRLVDGDDEGRYNREFVRWSVVPRAEGWPHPDLSLALSIDHWRSTADDFWTAGGDASWKLHPRFRAGLGSSYTLFAIDAFTGEEKRRVRTSYASIRWNVEASSVLEARLVSEKHALDTVRLLEIGIRHAF